MPSEKTTSDMSKSSLVQLRTPNGRDDSLTETGNVHGNQHIAKLKEIAEELRACSEIVDEFDTIFKRLWTLSAMTNATEQYPWMTDVHKDLLTVKENFTKKVTMKLQQLEDQI